MPDEQDRFSDVLAAYLEAVDAGWAPSRRQLLSRYPDLAAQLEEFFANNDRVEKWTGPVRTVSLGGTSTNLPAGTPLDGVPTITDQVPAHVPTTTLSDYEILEEVARGGMGVVYKARQKSLNRVVALKMILAGPFASPGSLQRFRNEAEAVARLDHPNIVPVYDVGQHDGLPFFTMKYIPGGSLARIVIAGLWSVTRKEDHQRAARLVATVARAVHHAHQRGILHRDLKPGNILLDDDEQPYITDFGLAKQLDGTGELTHSGAIIGTPNYMPPEQASPRKGELTTAADVYSLGAILYELLTTRPPFHAETPLATILLLTEQTPHAPSTINPTLDSDLEMICLKCLDKDPARRYATAAELADDLERWLQGEPVLARPATAWKRFRHWVRRKPATAGLTLAGIVGTLAVVAVGVSMYWTAHLAGVNQEFQQLTDVAEKESARADEARQKADEARQEAVENADRARRSQYVAGVQFAHRSWQDRNLDRMRELLTAEREADGDQELRGFEWHYLWRLCQPEKLRITGEGPFRCVAFSPDGKRLAAAVGQTVHLWDETSGKEILTLRNAGTVEGMAFTPDGKRIAVVGEKAGGEKAGEVRVWDAETGKELLTVAGHTGAVESVAFSPNGAHLVTGGADGTVQLWDAATGKNERTLAGTNFPVQSVAFAPDGKTIASASRESFVRLWDAESGKVQKYLKGHPSWRAGIAMSPDGKQIVTALANPIVPGDVVIYETALGREVTRLKGEFTEITALAFSPEGKRVATSGKGTATIWDAVTGKEMVTLHGHEGTITSLAFAPDGNSLATSGVDHTVRVWDLSPERESQTLAGHAGQVLCIAFSPDGTRLATGGSDKLAKVWDVSGQQLLTLRGQGAKVTCLAFSPDGKRLATGSRDDTVKLWDVETGRETRSFKAQGWVAAVAFSPDGRRLLTGGWDHHLNLWDAETGDRVMEPIATKARATAVAFSPDGKTFASAMLGAVTLWDAETGVERLSFPDAPAEFQAVGFSPDGKLAAAGGGRSGYPSEVRLWDVETGKEVMRLKGHTDLVSGLGFSGDGRRIATASADKTVRVWDVRTGYEVLSLRAHANSVWCVAFSPDGRRLASGDADGAIKMWTGTGPTMRVAGK